MDSRLKSLADRLQLFVVELLSRRVVNLITHWLHSVNRHRHVVTLLQMAKVLLKALSILHVLILTYLVVGSTKLLS